MRCRRGRRSGFASGRAAGALALSWTLLASAPGRAEFVDATGGSGLFGDLASWGGQAVDLDGDDDLDLVSPNHGLTVTFFANEGAGTFNTIDLPQIMQDQRDRHGILWADLDGDGILDGIVSHGGEGGSGSSDEANELWRGLGGGSLQLVAGAGGMADSSGRGRAFSAADIDGDGDLDLYHAKAPLLASPNSLYRNDGGMSFVDVAGDWGVDEIFGTVAGLFVDWDDDGDPDLFLGGEEFSRPTTLFRNDTGTFTDVTSSLFPGGIPVVAGADWGDFDNDGDPDLAVCEGYEGVWDVWNGKGTDFWFFVNHRFGDDGVDAFWMSSPDASPIAIFQYLGSFQPSRIFLGPSGVHPGSPVIVLTDAYVGEPSFTPGVDHGLYCWRESPGGPWQIRVSAPPDTYGNFSGTIYTTGGVAASDASNLEQLILPSGAVRLYRNDGAAFAEITSEAGFTPSANPRAVTWVDFDNDGDLDLHQAAKGNVEVGNEADVLWRNEGGTFTALGGSGWVPGDMAHLTDGGVWADLDRDGDLDLFLREGYGPQFFSNLAPSILYRNDGPAGHWLQLALGPTGSGGTSVGTKVAVHAAGLSVHRRVQANAWRGFQPPSDLHFGLGPAAEVDSVVIEWPSGNRQAFGPVAVDQRLSLTEGVSTAVLLPENEAPSPVRVWPQPARGRQWVGLDLPAGGPLRLEIFDVAGRHLRTILDGRRPEGPLRVSWDGRDAGGRPVAAGVYFLRTSGAARIQTRLVRLR